MSDRERAAAAPRALAEYGAIRRIPTRLADNDEYGHVNNSVYYQYFDTAVNSWLIAETGSHVLDLPAYGVVVSSSCQYLRQVRFPDQLAVGIDVARIGRTSVSYELGLFLDEEIPVLCALGTFVHVYVDPQERRPVPIPERVLAITTPLLRSRD